MNPFADQAEDAPQQVSHTVNLSPTFRAIAISGVAFAIERRPTIHDRWRAVGVATLEGVREMTALFETPTYEAVFESA